MAKLPQVAGLRVVRALVRIGWYIEHQRGSHVKLKSLKYPEKIIIVPLHGSKPVKKQILSEIIKDADLSIEDFKELL